MEHGKTLLIRVDGNGCIGTGHVMRCLALAQGWRDEGGTVMFASAALPPAFGRRLQHESCDMASITAQPGSQADAKQTADMAVRLGADWVAVDGYHFDAAYQDAIKSAGRRLLFFDDYGHAVRYAADLVLNQNLDADESLFQNRTSETQLLLGPRYALLRREFWPYRGWQRLHPEKATKLLITLGGADPDNVTTKALEAVVELNDPELHTIAIVGSLHPCRDALAQWAKGQPRMEVQMDVDHMPELMTWADVAIAAGGTTTWERCLVGLPSLMVILAENQAPIARAMLQHDSACVVPSTTSAIGQELRRLLVDRPRRQRMSQASQQLVDGWGLRRLLSRMMPPRLELRPSMKEDARMIFEWANQPATRRASFDAAPISWDNHVQWFETRLNDPHTLMFVVMQNGQAIGLIRFQQQANLKEATVSIQLDDSFQGSGLGPRIIQMGCSRCFLEWPVEQVRAEIRTDNVASLRAFVKAGFQDQQLTTVKGCPAYRLKLRRDHA